MVSLFILLWHSGQCGKQFWIWNICIFPTQCLHVIRKIRWTADTSADCCIILLYAMGMPCAYYKERTAFLVAFAKLRKATVSFVMSVCPSAWNIGSHRADFHEMRYWSIFLKSVKKLQVSLKHSKNNFAWRPVYIFDHISLNSSWNENFCRQKL